MKDAIGLILLVLFIGLLGAASGLPEKKYNVLKHYKGAVVVEKKNDWFFNNFVQISYKDSIIDLCLYEIEYNKINVGDTL